LNRCSHIVERYDVFMKRSAEFVRSTLALVAENVSTMPNMDVMFGYSNCTPSALIFSKVSDTVDGSSFLEDQKRRHNASSCLKSTEEGRSDS